MKIRKVTPLCRVVDSLAEYMGTFADMTDTSKSVLAKINDARQGHEPDETVTFELTPKELQVYMSWLESQLVGCEVVEYEYE